MQRNFWLVQAEHRSKQHVSCQHVRNVRSQAVYTSYCLAAQVCRQLNEKAISNGYKGLVMVSLESLTTPSM